MIALSVVLALFLVLAFSSSIHALGLWLAVLVVHGLIVLILGQVGVQLPLYTGILITIIILARKQWSGVSVSTIGLFSVLAVIMVISSFTGVNLNNSMFALMLYAKVFMLALLIAGCVKNENDIKVMLLYLLAALLIGALYAVYQYFTDTYSIDSYNTQRAAGLRGDPNETAMLLVAGLPVATYFMLNSAQKHYKLMFAACLPILLIGIVLTGSRGGFVALLFVMFIAYIRHPTIKLTIAGVVLVFMAGILAPSSYWDRMSTLVKGESTQNKSLSGRKLLISKGVQMFVENPAIGVGPGNFGIKFIEINSDSAINSSLGRAQGVDTHRGKAAVAHNLYLEFFAENGFFGGILLLAIFIISLRQLLKLDRVISSSKQQFGLGFAVTLSLAGMMFAGLFLSQGKNSVLWFLIGLGFAVSQVIAAHRKHLDLSADSNKDNDIDDSLEKINSTILQKRNSKKTSRVKLRKVNKH